MPIYLNLLGFMCIIRTPNLNLQAQKNRQNVVNCSTNLEIQDLSLPPIM